MGLTIIILRTDESKVFKTIIVSFFSLRKHSARSDFSQRSGLNKTIMKKYNNMHTSRWFPIILAFFLFNWGLMSCDRTPPPPKDLSELDWIIGKWKVGEGRNFETWTKINDQYYFGRNFRIYGKGDTAVQETIDLVLKDDEILYIPTVKSPKGDREVPFKMVSDSDKYFIFENPKHDFPKKISYTKFDKNTVRARIEGGTRKVDYQFIRQKGKE